MVYIGQTSNIIKRKHLYKYGRCKSQRMLYNSIQKYGWDNHSLIVLAECPDEYADNAEIEYIKYYNAYYTEGGMNLTTGGRKMKHTPESKRKLSEAISGAKNIKAKTLYQYDLLGNLIKIWDCMKCMERELGYATTAISDTIKRGSNYAYGFLWAYQYIDFTNKVFNRYQLAQQKRTSA